MASIKICIPIYCNHLSRGRDGAIRATRVVRTYRGKSCECRSDRPKRDSRALVRRRSRRALAPPPRRFSKSTEPNAYSDLRVTRKRRKSHYRHCSSTRAPPYFCESPRGEQSFVVVVVLLLYRRSFFNVFILLARDPDDNRIRRPRSAVLSVPI